MRKTLVAAIAALTAIGGASAALAQGTSGGLTIKPTISPTKAGTKKKPRYAKIRLQIANADHSLTATRIQVFLPKTATISTKGFKFCKQSKLDANGTRACPSKSKVGTGTAAAIAGVNTGGGAPLTFKVTAFLLSKTKVGFYLEQVGGSIKVTAVGKLKSASSPFGRKLDIAIPQIAKEFPAGVFNGLVSIDTTLGAKSGKHKLIATTGCKRHKAPFRAIVSFQPNPNPPVTPQLTADATAACK